MRFRIDADAKGEYIECVSAILSSKEYSLFNVPKTYSESLTFDRKLNINYFDELSRTLNFCVGVIFNIVKYNTVSHDDVFYDYIKEYGRNARTKEIFELVYNYLYNFLVGKPVIVDKEEGEDVVLEETNEVNNNPLFSISMNKDKMNEVNDTIKSSVTKFIESYSDASVYERYILQGTLIGAIVKLVEGNDVV